MTAATLPPAEPAQQADPASPDAAEAVPTRQRAYRLTLDPLPSQQEAFRQHAGTARWAFNHALDAKIRAHELWRDKVAQLVATGVPEDQARKQVKVPIPSMREIRTALNAVKGDETKGIDGPAAWWRSVSTYAFQAAFDNADRAWKNWRESYSGKRRGRRVGYPQFKKKGSVRDSFRLHHDVKNPSIRPDGYRRLTMPRLGSIRLKHTCKPLVRALKRGAVISSVTVSRGGTEWYAAVLVTEPFTPPQPTARQRGAGRVGVALGVRNIATLSTATAVDNPRWLARDSERLVKAQRAVSRSAKGSNRRAKRVRRLGQIHHKIAERRTGYLHEVTKRLATEWGEIAVPHLRVSEMVNVQRARRRSPNTHRARIAATNRALLDAAPAETIRQLTYKTSWYGSVLGLAEDLSAASTTCSHCGNVKAKLAVEERVYHCTVCATTLPRAVNTARNTAAQADFTVASDRGETQNARRAAVRPEPSRGNGQAAMKREDPG